MTIEECKKQIEEHYAEIDALYNKLNALESEQFIGYLDKFSEDTKHRYFYSESDFDTSKTTSVMYINNIEQDANGIYVMTCTFYDYHVYKGVTNTPYEYSFIQRQIKLPLRDVVNNFDAEKYITPDQFVLYKTQCELNILTQTDIPTMDAIINGIEV